MQRSQVQDDKLPQRLDALLRQDKTRQDKTRQDKIRQENKKIKDKMR